MANFTNRILWWCLVLVISIGIGAGSLLYRRHALSGPIQSGKLDPSRPEGLEKAFLPFMINLVLSESVGIFGLVLSFLSGQPAYSIAFAAGALVLMYLHRPTARDLVPPISGSQRGLNPKPIT
ncbi:MAG: hypothetical protein JRH19_25565 [Deltaproteobacteria bacterium]|nr:hypothetical protein [Deltaproteobacteria bacterium]